MTGPRAGLPITRWLALGAAGGAALSVAMDNWGLAGPWQSIALVLALLLGVWIVRSLRHTFWTPERNIGRTISRLLAGIVLVDLLAVVPAAYPMGLVFLLLFASALLFQRFVPAT